MSMMVYTTNDTLDCPDPIYDQECALRGTSGSLVIIYKFIIVDKSRCIVTKTNKTCNDTFGSINMYDTTSTCRVAPDVTPHPEDITPILSTPWGIAHHLIAHLCTIYGITGGVS